MTREDALARIAELEEDLKTAREERAMLAAAGRYADYSAVSHEIAEFNREIKAIKEIYLSED